jgi:hypothetical protein
VKEPNLALEAGQGLLSAVSSYSRGDMGGVFRSVTGVVKAATTGKGAEQRARQTKTSPADVVCMTSCCLFQLLRSCVDIVVWMQGFTNKCRCGRGWLRYWCHELRK